jgi:uncharacterized SAM-binding protein YcdF (DUF218 family)
MGLGALGLAYLVAAAWLDRRSARDVAPDARFDAIIVCGCRVRPDGTASPALARRARHAAALYRRGHAPLIVFTGGVGTHPPSEARAAAAVARAEGVPERAIVLEERSTSTEENALEASRLVDARRVLVVTDAYHAFRAERVFRRYFEEVVAVGSRGSRSVRVRGALREVAVVLTYALLGRL